MDNRQKISELEQQLASLDISPDGDLHQKIDLLNDLAWTLADTDMKRAYALSEEAFALADSALDGRPYQEGMAYSLRTLGYLNQRFGDYPLGLKQLFASQELFVKLQEQGGLCDVFDGMASIYYQIGEYQEALECAYKQLKIAESIGDRWRVANAYNNLGAIYFEINEPDKSIETHQKNLQLALEIGYDLAYFFPRVSVLSDTDVGGLAGVDTEEFTYRAGRELNNDFADFTVNVNVPPNFIVWATGELQNVNEVLQPEYAARLQESFTSDEIINIAQPDEIQQGLVTAQTSMVLTALANSSEVICCKLGNTHQVLMGIGL